MSQTHDPADHGSPPSTPRWLKVSVIIIVVLVLLFVVLNLAGLHSMLGMHTPPTEQGTQQP